MINSQKDIENAFYTDGYKLGMKVADSGMNQDILLDSVSEMYDAIDSFIDSFTEFAEKQNQQIDCKKGCEWCCHQPVFALDYEMEYLNDFVRSNFSLEIQNEIKKQAENKNKKLSILKEDDLLNAKYPCPLLENGACTAYKARPMACRIYLSTDVKSCLNFYHRPESKSSIPSLLNLTLRCGQKMNEGFKAALKINGIQTQEFRIEEKLMLV
jgi:Fe-S-cluster containining protein